MDDVDGDLYQHFIVERWRDGSEGHLSQKWRGRHASETFFSLE